MQPGDHVCTARPPRRVQRPESGATDPLTGNSDRLENTATERSRKLLLRTAGPYRVRCVMESTVIVEKKEFIILMSSDRLTSTLQVPSNAELTAVLHGTICQPKLRVQRDGAESNLPPANSNNREHASYAIETVFGHCGTKGYTEHKV